MGNHTAFWGSLSAKVDIVSDPVCSFPVDTADGGQQTSNVGCRLGRPFVGVNPILPKGARQTPSPQIELWTVLQKTIRSAVVQGEVRVDWDSTLFTWFSPWRGACWSMPVLTPRAAMPRRPENGRDGQAADMGALRPRSWGSAACPCLPVQEQSDRFRRLCPPPRHPPLRFLICWLFCFKPIHWPIHESECNLFAV